MGGFANGVMDQRRVIDRAAEHDMVLCGPVIHGPVVQGPMIHDMMGDRVMDDGVINRVVIDDVMIHRVMIHRMMGGGMDDDVPGGFGSGGGLSRLGGEKACGATD